METRTVHMQPPTSARTLIIHAYLDSGQAQNNKTVCMLNSAEREIAHTN